MVNGYRVWMQVIGSQVEIPPSPTPEELQAARYERDTAAAEAARIKRELEEIKRQLPTEEQRARWAELETEAQKAEEERIKKSGEFDNWRTMINDKHAKELNDIAQQRENEAAKRASIESELTATLVGREFADAVDLFGPAGKTVLLPAVAQSYFAPHVAVETATGPDGRVERRVVVKDAHGTVIVDPKTGRPLPFAKAMWEVIEAHPQKAYLLRGSGKVGAGSPGGGYDGDGGVDISRLKSGDFQDPKVREAVRAKMNVAGGLQFGPGFDKLRRQKDKS